jgi:hypothetical protein
MLGNLTHNTELQTITVGLDLQLYHYSINAILSLFGPISSSIRDVVFNTFKLVFFMEDGSEDIMGVLKSLDMRELDEFFCQPQFLYLQAVSFRLHESDKYGEVERAIALNMPACLSRGILSIQNA